MILGIHGRLHSGKDTVLERLKVLFPGKFVRHAFADKLKVSAMASLGFRKTENRERSDVELIALANSLKETGDITIYFMHAGEPHLVRITGRQYLQYKGTEGGRDVFGANFWVDQAMGPALRDEAEGLVPALTDTRFDSEADALLEQLGEVWRVVGPNDETGDHPSEIPLPDGVIATTIDNTVRGDGFANLDRQLLQLGQERLGIEEGGV